VRTPDTWSASAPCGCGWMQEGGAGDLEQQVSGNHKVSQATTGGAGDRLTMMRADRG
jgi:hypothetical protein